MKKPLTDHIGDFIAGRGFYIVLFLCVAAIGISGYYLFTTLGPDKDEVSADAPAQVVVTPAPSPKVTTPAVKPTVQPTPQPTPTATPEPTPTPTPTPKASPSSKPTAVYTWPVKGEVIRDFSLEVLAYDKTMGDWRTHSGMDIAASVGTHVIAMSAGTVEEVYQDDLMGTTVVIEHGNGLSSMYCNLAATPAVEVGDEVFTGDVIGSVGGTALAEIGHESHLHLELFQNDTAVDPALFLP